MSESTVDLLIKIDKIAKIIVANGGDVSEMKKFSLTDGVANKDAREYYAMLRTNYSDSFYQVIDSKTAITSHTVGSSKKGKSSR